jgi:phosphohistidine phosphatase SixA
MRTELYLLRHGITEARAVSGRDADRALSRDGIEGVRSLFQGPDLAGISFALIASSPYRRALSTAKLAADALQYTSDIVTSTALTPDSAPVELWEEVRVLRFTFAKEEATPRILVVAHEPLLSATASWMLGASRVMVEFYPATLARIDFEDLQTEPRGVLRGLYRPA